MELVRDDAAAIDWMGGKTGRDWSRFLGHCIVSDGEIRGAVMWSGYNNFNIQIDVWMPGCFSKGIWGDIFHFAFDEMECLRVTASTHRGHVVMRRIIPRLGFKFECVTKHMYGATKDMDGLQFAMFRPEAERWMRYRHVVC